MSVLVYTNTSGFTMYVVRRNDRWVFLKNPGSKSGPKFTIRPGETVRLEAYP